MAFDISNIGRNKVKNVANGEVRIFILMLMIQI